MEERPFAVTRGFFISSNTRPLQRIHTCQQPTATNTPIAAPRIISEQRRGRPFPGRQDPYNPILGTGPINHNEGLGQTDLDMDVRDAAMTTAAC